MDDDNDGFVDINDQDCDCFEIHNLVPNGDFELYLGIPFGPEKVNYATGWLRCCTENGYLNANASYNHQEGYHTSEIVFPYPSGNGMVSAFYNFIEMPIVQVPPPNFPNFDFAKRDFFGTNLPEPLQPDVEYNFSMFMIHAGFGESNLIPLTFIVYGKTSPMEEYEINFGYCPGEIDEDWEKIVEIEYNPSHEWQKVSSSFMVNQDISAIIIGISCQVPGAYYNLPGSKVFGFDNIIITEKSDEFFIETFGAICHNNLILSAHTNDDFIPSNYQWYLNGVAIPNATDSTFSIREGDPEGYYAVRAMNANECLNSFAYHFKYPNYDFDYQIMVNDQDKSMQINFENVQDFTYSVDGIHYQSSNIFTDLQPDDYTLFIKNNEGCVVKEIGFAIFELYNVFTPNSDGFNDTWWVKGLENYPGSRVQIFDKMGIQKLDYIIPENLDKFEWKGENLSSGTYWYLIDISPERKIRGSVTIIRK